MYTTRFLSAMAILALLLNLSPAFAGQSTLIESSLTRLEQSSPSSPDRFDFIVVGDSNTLKPLEASPFFTQSIEEFNILKPDFVLHVGDIILGGSADGVPPQWDHFDQIIAKCEPPFLPIPGNHDISDEATEQIWQDRIGPTHYSFQYGNSFFIFLNSEEVGAVERISNEQVAWLKHELESTNAKNVFLFLHQPYFEHEGDPDTAPTYWEKHWANVAGVLKGHPVKAVFSGHRHLYRDCGLREGVRYVICGGASVYGKSDEATGGFNHYLKVQVRGEDVSWAVIKPGAVLPQDAITSARIDELYNVQKKWIDAEGLPVPLGDAIDRDLAITIHNPHETPMASSLTWTTPPGWDIAPKSIDYHVDAKSQTALTFRVKVTDPEQVRFPAPVFATRYEKTQHGPAVDVVQDLKLVPTFPAARASGAITLDGVLDEWDAAQIVPVTYPVNFDGKDPEDLQCQIRFLWDADWLYLAVETEDNEYHQPYSGDPVWAADNVELFLDDWSWGLTLTKNGPEVFLYWGVDVSAETVNTDTELAVKRDGTKMVYEAAFPKSHLTPLKLAEGNSFRFSLLMNDLDPSHGEGKRHWLTLVPGAASQGSQKPRMKVVLGK